MDCLKASTSVNFGSTHFIPLSLLDTVLAGVRALQESGYGTREFLANVDGEKELEIM